MSFETEAAEEAQSREASKRPDIRSRSFAYALRAIKLYQYLQARKIAQKESRESLYWLRLLANSAIVRKSHLEPLMQETKEITAVITAILIKCKGTRRRQSS
jgi:hypothetical protein